MFIEDPRMFRRVVEELRRRGAAFTVPREPSLPKDISGAILLTDVDVQVDDGRVFRVTPDDWERRVEEALCALRGKTAYHELLVGVDPGEPPIYAVVADGELVAHGAADPERVVDEIRRLLERVPHMRAVVRIGDSGPNVDTIIEQLAAGEPLPARVELVDERGTSKRNLRLQVKDRDVASAVNIALRRGVWVEGVGKVEDS